MQIANPMTFILSANAAVRQGSQPVHPTQARAELSPSGSITARQNSVAATSVFSVAGSLAARRDTALFASALQGPDEVPSDFGYIADTYPDVSIKDAASFLSSLSEPTPPPKGVEALRALRPDLEIERLSTAFDGVRVQSTPRSDDGTDFDLTFDRHLNTVQTHPAFTIFAGEEIALVQPQSEPGTASIYEMSFKDDNQALHNHPHAPRMLIIHTGDAPAGISFGGVRSSEEIGRGVPIDLVRLDFEPNSTTFLGFPAGMMHAFSGKFFAQSIHADDGAELDSAISASGLTGVSTDDPELMTLLSIIAAPDQRVDTGERISVREFNDVFMAGRS